MRKKLRPIFPLSIRSLIIIFCIPFLIIILLSCLYFQNAGKEQITSLIQSNAISIVNQVSDTMEEKINDVQLLPMSVTGSFRYYKIRENILNDEDIISPNEYKKFSDSVYDFLEINANYFDSVFFYLDDYTICMYRSNSDKRLFKSTFSYDDYADTYTPYSLNWITGDSGAYPYSLLPNVAYSQNALMEILGNENSDVHGVLLFGINDELFTSSLINCKITPSSCVTLVKDGKIQYSSSDFFQTDTLETLAEEDLALIAEKSQSAVADTIITYESKGNYFIYRPLADQNMGVLAVIPLNEMYLDYHNYSKIVLQFGLLLIFACLLLYFIITITMSTPLQSLVKQIHFISQNHLDDHIKVSGSKEIHIVADSINNLITRVNILMKNLELEMLAKQNAELQALYFQINPHFLYNTLDCIGQLCDLNQSQKAGQMVSQLATFYRIGVSKGKNEITLQDEITHVKMYLKILQTRFDDFQYAIQIPDELLGCPIIKLVLQPLVENAVYHGLRPYRTDGTVTISAGPDGDDLLISVSDNGGGIDANILTDIKNILQQPANQTSANIYGIKNVHDRLRLTYGKKYGLTIDSELEEGTTVTIRIPYKNKPAL